MMKSAFVLVAVSLCGIFVPAIDGLSCYKCSWTDKTCNAETLMTNMPKEKCGNAPAGSGPTTPKAPGGGDSGASAAPPADGGSDAPPASDAPAPEGSAGRSLRNASQAAGGMHRAIRSKPFLVKMADEPTYHCFKVHVKANDTSSVMVERGCKESVKTDDCLALDKTQYPKGVVEKCTTCSEDDCNSGLSMSSNALLIQGSLLLATWVAKNVFQTN